MVSQELREVLIKYNSIFKEIDEVYHLLARHYGLSDCALWILYILRESEDIHTQAKICEGLSLSKQTVNSALKNLEKSGYIMLKSLMGNNKNKQIVLTEAGEAFAKQTVDNILVMEQNAFGSFSFEQRTLFLQLNERYVSHLQREAKKILSSEQQNK